MSYPQLPEIVLSGIPGTEIEVPELSVSYTRSSSRIFEGTIASSADVARFLRSTFGKDEIELQEQFIVIYLNQARNIIGYYRHSKGGINSTIADKRIVIGTALKCAAVSLIVAHNHPSGNLKPSEADLALTKGLREGCTAVSITLLDHIIITKDNYYSFGDEGLLGLSGLSALQPAGTQLDYVQKMVADLRSGVQYNKRSTEKLAAAFGIEDKTMVKELTELAIVQRARELAHAPGTTYDRYQSIVDLYNTQANLSHRTSNSILLQQYSTPAPIAYLAGVFAGLNEERLFHLGNRAFEALEPSAGNGLLTVAGQPHFFRVNEIDELRRTNLISQGYREVTALDASQPFPMHYVRRFDAVLTNPPFGSVDVKIDYDGYKIGSLEQLMALRALDCMSDSGRAAIIIGGHTTWDELGRIQAGKNRIFFNYLYTYYKVEDVINIDGQKLYSRQGTSFDVRLILISRRKSSPSGVTPMFNPDTDTVVADFDTLYERVAYAMNMPKNINTANQMATAKSRALAFEIEMEMEADGLNGILVDELGMPYTPASDAGKSLQTQVPDSMAFETHEALQYIQQEVGGDVDNFVRDRLGYPTLSSLGNALSAEQIDAVAMAIYNIEGRRQGMIIGDQTGIGKGRVAAAIIRYACQQGIRPIFLTEKPNLFSDIYRDLKAIGSADLVPFIINGKESKTDIKDEDGNIIYTALTPPEQQTIFESRLLPGRFHFTVGTYSQFNSPETKPVKPAFLQAIAEDTIMILDEAHNSSGSSNTGTFLKGVVKSTKGVIFLSATFAKRPDNMPIYAMKTCMADCALSDEDLVSAIESGGVALQEVISSQLVSEGQMLRRERSYEGIEVNYLTMEDKAQEHKATADIVTGIIRRIIAFQIEHVEPAVKMMDKIVAAESKEVVARKGTEKAGVDNTPYFSKVFNVINQMLFAIKAEAVADRAIERLREGKKPVIAFSSTMGAFLETMENERGMPIADGDVIKADFSEVLKRGIDGIMKITVRDERGQPSYEHLPLSELSQDAVKEYYSILADIEKVSTGLCLSPIDVLIEKIQAAGYSVSEVTGRKVGLKVTPPNHGYSLNRVQEISKAEWLDAMHEAEGRTVEHEAHRFTETLTVPHAKAKAMTGMVYMRRKENTNDAFRRFNNNEVDVLLINQSGSTGASAHAIPTAKVPASEVKQRVMIVLQAELDINTEVQKRGRINRTGQILKPIYDYLTSAIPAEQRLMMMLQKKLKSLDANTSSNQKQSSSMLDVPDFLNKYGDRVVKEYLMDNPEMNILLDDPLSLKDSDGEGGGSDRKDIENAAQKVSGRVAVLSTEMQKAFYDDISSRYNDLVGYLKQAGEYDLELEAMNLQAETVRSSVISVGSGGGSPFGENVNLEWAEVNVLRKPYTATELTNMLIESLGGKEAKMQQQELSEEFKLFQQAKLKGEIEALNTRYERLLAEVPEHKSVRNAKSDSERIAAIKEQEAAVHGASELAAKKALQKSRNIEESLSQYFRFFHVGRVCSYPVAVMGMGVENIPTVFLGFIIDRRKPNPFAPSSVKLRFAIANGMKYLELPASMSGQISPIVAASINTRQYSNEELAKAWEGAVAGSQAARKKRYIITGNLLQALGKFKGRLIDYTTLSGGNEKGLLMPDNWNPDERGSGGDTVSVPVAKAVPLIKSMMPGTNMKCSNALIIAREYGARFKLYVPASRQGGGDIYMDKDLWPLIEKGMWEKQSDKMVTWVQSDRIDEFLALVGDRHPGTVQVAKQLMAQVNTDGGLTQRRHYTVRMPAPAPTEPPLMQQSKEMVQKVDELRLRALALEMEMEMENELG